MYYFMLLRIISYGKCFRFASGKNMFILFHTEKHTVSAFQSFIGYNTGRKVDH